MMVNGQWSIVNGESLINAVLLNRKTLSVFFCLLALSIPTLTFSQSASAALDRDKILLGEQVTLQFNLNNLNPLTTYVSTWPAPGDTMNHVEIVKRNDIDTVNVNGLNSYEQKFTLTGFDSGRWQLGPFNFVLQDKTTGKQINLSTQPLYLTVLPVDVSSLNDYHPIKDVIEVNTTFNWLPVIIVATLLIAGVVIFIVLKKRKKRPTPEPEIVLKGTPFERAVEKLRELQDQPLNSVAEKRKFHSDVDIICRQYFEEMLHVKALQATTSELFSRMNVYMQDQHLRSKMRQLFDLHASVKFAKYMPDAEESRAALKETIACLGSIEGYVQQSTQNADRLVPKY